MVSVWFFLRTLLLKSSYRTVRKPRPHSGCQHLGQKPQLKVSAESQHQQQTMSKWALRWLPPGAPIPRIYDGNKCLPHATKISCHLLNRPSNWNVRYSSSLIPTGRKKSCDSNHFWPWVCPRDKDEQAGGETPTLTCPLPCARRAGRYKKTSSPPKAYEV